MGRRAVARALARDAVEDARRLLVLEPLRLRWAAWRAFSRRRVLVVAATLRPERRPLLDAAVREMRRSRHQVEVVVGPGSPRGKFAALNALVAERGLDVYDWLVAMDDDVVLPRGFLDGFLFLAERFDLTLAQPAHRQRSHAAWPVTRRHPGSVARTTGFVEIGPLTAFRAAALGRLLPFPDVGMGWGLDVHWSALARERGWRLGIVDALAIVHTVPPAGNYDWQRAAAEGARFLADRPYVPAAVAARTLAVHRCW